MLGPALYVVGALAFLFIDPSSALTQKQANSVCALLPSGEKISNDVVCSQFYVCDNKGRALLNSCLGNMLFSKEDQSCLPPDQTTCGQPAEDPCEYMQDGYYVGVANSCSDFLYCSGGVGQKSSCPNGLNFDQGTQACKYPSDYPCTVSNPQDGSINVCEVVRSGIYFGSSSSCSAWQKCQYSGPPESGVCAAPTVFNVDTQGCDYKDRVNCRQSQGGGSGGNSLQGTSCSVKNEVVPDPNKCAGYYVCTNLKYAFGQCTNGLYFNPKTNQCVNRMDAVNDCDRCQGTKRQFVNAYQDDCTGYLTCLNGKTQSTGQCAEGYFDELSGSCVNGVNPMYPVCYVQPEVTTVEPSTETPKTPVTDAPTSKTTESKNTDKTTKEKDTTTEATTKATEATEETKPPKTTTIKAEESDEKTNTDEKESEEPGKGAEKSESEEPKESGDESEDKEPDTEEKEDEPKESEEEEKTGGKKSRNLKKKSFFV